MSVTTQEFQQTPANLKFKLKVKYDSETITHLPTARLISKDLRVKVKDVGIIFETHKKAWVVEQIEMSENKLISSILQQTVTGAWISFDVIHEKDVSIEKVFVEHTRASRDMSMMLYPFYLLTGIMLLVEILLLKKTLIDKEIIILTKHDWQNIAWISVAVVGWFLLFFLWLRKKKLHEAYFQCVGDEYITERTFDFYFIMKNQIGQKKTMRYSLTAQNYYGEYYHPDLPKVEHFKNDRTDLNTIQHTRHELTRVNDQLHEIRVRKMSINEEIDTVKQEQRELDQELDRMKTNNDQEQIDQIKTMTDKTPPIITPQELMLDTRISENKELLDLKNDEFVKMQGDLNKEEKIAETKKLKLEKELYEMLKDVFSKNESIEKEEDFEQIIYAHQINSSLRTQLAQKTNIIISQAKNIGSLYSTQMQLDESFDQRVASESARISNSDYGFVVVSDPNDSRKSMIYNEGLQQKTNTRGRGGIGANTNTWLNGLFTLLIVFGIVGACVWAFIEISKALSNVHPFYIILIVIGIGLILLLVNKLVSRAMKYARDDDSSVNLS